MASPARVRPGALEDIRVSVRNGSEDVGLALRTVRWLRSQGMSQADMGRDAQRTGTTTLFYRPGQVEQARVLADRLWLPAYRVVPLAASDMNPGADVQLTIGEDYQPGIPLAAPIDAPPGLQQHRADDADFCAR